MRICFITKYPPIEGGTASRIYWLAKGLGEKGHEIHIITNAWETESKFIEKLKVEDLKDYQPKGVRVHSTSPFLNHSYIPASNPFTEKLANEAFETIRKNNLQLIDSCFLLPYVSAGFFAKILTHRPQILRHAGSDLNRLYRSPFLRTFFTEIFKKVDKIITYPGTEKIFLNAGVPKRRICTTLKTSVNTQAFSPKVKPFDLSKLDVSRKVPVFTYIGKVNRSKGIFEFIEALGKIKKNFTVLFVASGGEKDELEKSIENSRLKAKSIVLDFLPPWRIPSIIRASTCVVHPEQDFPIPGHQPILIREVMATGRCLVLSEELYKKRHSTKIKDGRNVLVVNPKDISLFRKTLERIIENPNMADEIGQKARKVALETENFEKYVNETEKLYNVLISEK